MQHQETEQASVVGHRPGAIRLPVPEPSCVYILIPEKRMAITDDDEAWRKAFTAAVADVGDRMSYQQAAERLRSIVCTGLLTQTDIVERPHRFYEAHRLTARESMRLGPGLVNRFTVHYNLFAGTVIALGTREQIAQMVTRKRDAHASGASA